MSEDKVFQQKVSQDELENVSGGSLLKRNAHKLSEFSYTCVDNSTRMSIYGGNGFPNCAATVEDGSWCERNDGCFNNSVHYEDMVDCSKAWQ